MAAYLFNKTNGTLNIGLNGKSYIVTKEHLNYKKIKENLSNDKILVKLLDVSRTVARRTSGGVTIDNGVVLYCGQEMHNVITDMILELVQENLPFSGMVMFLENLMQNPDKRAVDELYPFLAKLGIPITERGTFLCYKAVDKDYWSKTAGNLTLIKGKVDDEGHIYNAPGEEIECVRNQVCSDKDRHCSQGLHAGAIKYVATFGYGDDKTIVVEINPKDVVSIPADSNGDKLRVCAYKVLCDYTGTLERPMYNTESNSPLPTKEVDYYEWEQDEDYYGDDEDDYEYDVEDDEYFQDTYGDNGYKANENTPKSTATFGYKPNGQRYHNYRVGGKFAKKQ